MHIYLSLTKFRPTELGGLNVMPGYPHAPQSRNYYIALQNFPVE